MVDLVQYSASLVEQQVVYRDGKAETGQGTNGYNLDLLFGIIKWRCDSPWEDKCE